jgi:ATP-binding cassette subfamily B protein
MTALAQQAKGGGVGQNASLPQSSPAYDFDLKNAVTANRLAGLWAMMTGFRWRFLGATVALAVGAAAKTATYLLLREFVDGILGVETRPSALALIALAFIGLAVLEGGFTFLSGRLAAQTAEGIARRLRNYLYDHIQRLTFGYHDRMQTGELIQRSTSDVDAMRRFYAEQALGIGRIILLFSINFFVVARLNLRLALLSVIVVPLIVIMSYFFFKKISRAYEKYQEQEAALSTVLQENLSGVRVVKAFARQAYERDKFEKENWKKYSRGRSLMLAHSLFWPVSDILCGAQMLFGFTVGALMAINGEITVGTYLAYAGLLVWIIFPMRNLGRLIVQMSTGMVSYRRVIDVISQDREPLDEGTYVPDGPVRGDVDFKFVSFGYDPTQPVLSNINLKVRAGQAVALLGSTGSGKTTLVNLLPRFYEYTDGAIKLDGVELTDYPRAYLRSQIGIVEQEPFLFSKTIKENIKIGVDRPVSDEEVIASAKAAAIHDSIMTFPEGYDTLVGEKGVTLSGGQKQRVAIARTLLKDPRILILDDSTSSVDMETEAEIRAALEVLMQGRTTFIIAHRVQSLMNADQIVVLDKGKIVQHGTHETLLEEEGLYRQIYDLQARVEEELRGELTEVATN